MQRIFFHEINLLQQISAKSKMVMSNFSSKFVDLTWNDPNINNLKKINTKNDIPNFNTFFGFSKMVFFLKYSKF